MPKRHDSDSRESSHAKRINLIEQQQAAHASDAAATRKELSDLSDRIDTFAIEIRSSIRELSMGFSQSKQANWVVIIPAVGLLMLIGAQALSPLNDGIARAEQSTIDMDNKLQVEVRDLIRSTDQASEARKREMQVQVDDLNREIARLIDWKESALVLQGAITSRLEHIESEAP